jgi:CTP synthase
MLEEEGLGNLLVNKLNLKAETPELSQWKELVHRLQTPREPINIALVGKYVELHDSYYSVREALHHAALQFNRDVNLLWIPSESLEKGDADSLLRSTQGIVMPGGFGIRGIEGMIKAVTYAREHNVPYLGLCLGMQVMVIEFSRHIFNSSDANSTEFNPDTKYPVIDYLPEQKNMKDNGRDMRLGELSLSAVARHSCR